MSAPIGAIAPGHYEVLIWGSIGVVAAMLLGFGLLWLRGKYHPDNIADGSSTATFSMQSIEEIHNRGLISDEEFRRLRAGSLGLDAPTCDNDNSVLSRPGDVDDGTEEPVLSNEPQDHKESK